MYTNVDKVFFCFVTMHQFERQTDRQKGLGNTVRCTTCSRTLFVLYMART